MSEDNRRGKKSFSERDKELRERKYKGDHDTPGASRQQRSHEYRSYKNQLNKIFDGGGLPAALKEKLEGTEVGQKSKAKKEQLKAIKEAAAPRAILAAYRSYRESHDFPEDEEVLAKLLELEDEPSIVVEALEQIDALHAEGRLKRASSLKMRIKSAQMTIDDDDVWAAAGALLKKL